MSGFSGIRNQYLSGKTKGDAVLYAPDTPGSYDVRLHDSDSDGKEVFYVAFTVGEVEDPAGITSGEEFGGDEG